jgi:16S rRNA (cytosine1402-N4)-methyltransferase
MQNLHTSVLLQEAIDGLNLKAGATTLDATLGVGGHTRAIAERIGDKGTLVGIDADRAAITRAKTALSDFGFKGEIKFFNTNFRHLDQVLKDAGEEKIDAVLFDLGLSSPQIESSGRGFTFRQDEPLVMTFAEEPKPEEVTALDVVNSWSEETLTLIISSYGEEKFARRIAKAIVEHRDAGPITTTAELSSIIEQAIPYVARKKQKIHPATRTFQGIRMAVNDEVGALNDVLPKAFEALNHGGRMAVISFHSIEDRIVKRYFLEKGKAGEAKIITKRPLIANEEETKENPRARSAKLRILEKI